MCTVFLGRAGNFDFIFFQKKSAEVLVVIKKVVLLHSLRPNNASWRDGRVVDYSSLENCRAERHRGFESLSLRFEELVDIFSGFFFISGIIIFNQSPNLLGDLS